MEDYVLEKMTSREYLKKYGAPKTYFERAVMGQILKNSEAIDALKTTVVALAKSVAWLQKDAPHTSFELENLKWAIARLNDKIAMKQDKKRVSKQMSGRKRRKK